MKDRLPPPTPKVELRLERIHARMRNFKENSGMSDGEMHNHFGLISIQKTTEALRLQTQETPSTPRTPTLTMADFNGWDQVAKQLFPKKKNVTGWFRG